MISIINTYLDDEIPHWHNRLQHVQYHTIVLVTEGRLRYELNEQSFMAAKGDLLFIPSGTQREAYNDGLTLHQKYAIIFSGRPDPSLPIFEKSGHSLIRSRGFEYFKERIILVHRHSLEQKPYYDTIRAGILLEILGMASRELASPPIPFRKAQYAWIIEEYIMEHFKEPITLNELGKLIQRSPNYTLAVFKEATGQTPLAYMHQLRTTAAMDLLQNTNLSVKLISEHLGYYDTSYFNRVFRRNTGLSPSHYAAHAVTKSDERRL